MKMNPQAKSLWCSAMESDEFDQTDQKLVIGSRDGGFAYCCLGVMIVVAIRAGLDTVRITDWGEVQVYRYGDWVDWIDGDLPREVYEWAGIERSPVTDESCTLSNPVIDPAHQFAGRQFGPLTAISANDDEELTFQQIAAKVREHL